MTASLKASRRAFARGENTEGSGVDWLAVIGPGYGQEGNLVSERDVCHQQSRNRKTNNRIPRYSAELRATPRYAVPRRNSAAITSPTPRKIAAAEMQTRTVSRSPWSTSGATADAN